MLSKLSAAFLIRLSIFYLFIFFLFGNPSKKISNL